MVDSKEIQMEQALMLAQTDIEIQRQSALAKAESLRSKEKRTVFLEEAARHAGVLKVIREALSA